METKYRGCLIQKNISNLNVIKKQTHKLPCIWASATLLLAIPYECCQSTHLIKSVSVSHAVQNFNLAMLLSFPTNVLVHNLNDSS